MKWFLLLSGILCLYACGSGGSTEEEASKNNKTKPNNDLVEQTTAEEPGVPVNRRQTTVKAAKLVYEYSGKWIGTETIWFDQYGNRAVAEQDIDYGAVGRNKTRLIWDGEEGITCFYMQDGEELNKYTTSGMQPIGTDLCILGDGKESSLSYAYDKIGTEQILGKETVHWKGKHSDVEGWVWNGIDFNYDNQGIVKKIKSFDLIDQIPPEKMQIPEGFVLN